MRSSTIAAAVMALASAVSAQEPGFAVFSTPKSQELVPAGKTYPLKWTAGNAFSGPAVLSLIGGETQPTQQFIANLTTLEVGANAFDWPVDCSLGKAKVYGLTITMVSSPGIFQWSQPFRIDNSGCAGQGSSAASSVASTVAPVSSSAVASSVASSSAAAYPTAPISSTKVATATTSAAPVTVSSKSNTESHAAQTSSVVTKSSASAVPTASGTSIPVAAAPKVAAGSFALAGAAVAAILAL